MEIFTGNPYKEEIINDLKIRTFDICVQEEELIWHRDKLNRYVRVLEGKNWHIQLDDQLPIRLEQNVDYFIPSRSEEHTSELQSH